MERAVVLANEPVLAPVHFPTLRRPGLPAASPAAPQPASSVAIPGSTLATIEREAILRTLEAVGGSTSRAAQMLKISPRKIQYKLKEYQQDGVLAGRHGGGALAGAGHGAASGRRGP
jgi:DNA-binding NtrC family response regulator